MNNEFKLDEYKFSDTEEDRKKSLRKLIVIYGPKDLIKKLKELYIANKQKENSFYINSDIKWISSVYKKKPNKSRKKSRKKSKRKSRKSKKVKNS